MCRRRIVPRYNPKAPVGLTYLHIYSLLRGGTNCVPRTSPFVHEHLLANRRRIRQGLQDYYDYLNTENDYPYPHHRQHTIDFRSRSRYSKTSSTSSRQPPPSPFPLPRLRDCPDVWRSHLLLWVSPWQQESLPAIRGQRSYGAVSRIC